MFVVHSKEEEEQKVLKPQRLVEPKQVTITLHFKDEVNCRIRANCGSEIIRNCILSKTGTQNTRNSVFKHVASISVFSFYFFKKEIEAKYRQAKKQQEVILDKDET